MNQTTKETRRRSYDAVLPKRDARCRLILETLGEGVIDQATNCGLSCFGGAPDCAATCVEDATGLSGGCSECFAGIIQCTIDDCLDSCIADPSGTPCIQCQETNCLPPFAECSGLEGF